MVERDDLAFHEARITRGLATFIEVGEALSTIRDRRLYRSTHDTFESYCREKWGMSKRHCDRLIQSSDVVKDLGPIGPAAITSEAQARELARVEPEYRQHVVAVANKVTGGKITAAAIREVANHRAAENSPPRPKREKFKMPDRGMFIARGAINQLETILPNDGERSRALAMVGGWCGQQLSAATPRAAAVALSAESGLTKWRGIVKDTLREFMSVAPVGDQETTIAVIAEVVTEIANEVRAGRVTEKDEVTS